MAEIPTAAKTRPQAARALLGGSVVSCPGCGKPLAGRQKACSGRCRALLSRRRRIPLKAEDLRELRALTKGLLEDLYGLKVLLDRVLP